MTHALNVNSWGRAAST